MDDARKYYGVLSMALSLRTYKKIRSAYRVRNEKKILLESLIKKAKEAFEAEQAQVCEKGKVHGESEQTPQEHVISASKPPYVYEHPLPKGLKRSWNSAFEPNVLNKSTFCESLSLGVLVRLGAGGLQVFLKPSLQLPKPLCHISLFLVLCCWIRTLMLIILWAFLQCLLL